MTHLCVIAPASNSVNNEEISKRWPVLDNPVFNLTDPRFEPQTSRSRNKRVADPFNGRVDRAPATNAVDSGSIPGKVKPKIIKIGIYSFPA